ncbi:MAG TPA: cytochrome C oxidase subunit IV family protein [Candidatus Paceibacterota bacterium]|nr:cytochrome C oxidase subunit IV family protein [Candidatus Paceibacterota bacterium]
MKNEKAYVIGFSLSILLTLAAYVLVEIHAGSAHETISPAVLIPLILGFAVLQLVVQMFFFLHVGAKPGRTWKLAIFFTTLGLVLIITVGSLWIMDHLNYNMMADPAQMQQYINDQQGF